MILCGDSAGGNLVLWLLSHLLHPHPSIPQLKLPKAMLGAALISPWGQFDTSAPSYPRNRYKDSIDAPVLQKWSAYFMGAADPDNYNQPFLAAAGWWAGLNEVVQDVRVTAGTDEVLVDDISAFAEILKVCNKSTRIDVCLRVMLSRVPDSNPACEYSHRAGRGS